MVLALNKGETSVFSISFQIVFIDTYLTTSKNNKMKPIWEKFPTFEKYTIGWRMGYGEVYKYKWHDFINAIPTDYKSRLNYLKDHRPAPINRSDLVLNILYPGMGYDHYDFEPEDKKQQEIMDLGLITDDAAYKTWILQQSRINWPWLGKQTPENTARYSPREFWFFSRQLKAAKKTEEIQICRLPKAWRCLEGELNTGKIEKMDFSRGLMTLAQMLCVGSVKAPWQLGIPFDELKNTFADHMGYADAFRLWLISAFDDNQLVWKMFDKAEVPEDWMKWMEEETDYY